MRLLVAACTLLLATPAATPAMAQVESREGLALQNQILQLRRDLAGAQQGGGYRPDYERPAPRGNDGGLTSQLLDRVTQLEEQTRQLRGEIDRLGDLQRRSAEDTDKRIADLSFAVQNGAAQTGAATRPPRNPPPSDPVLRGDPPPRDAPAGPVPRTAELAMQEGNAALARRDYAAAEAAAREVIGKRGPRAGDAQYLLAQSELGSRNYQQAAPDFYDAYNRQRTGPRGASALLGVANALVGLNDKASACEALNKLRAEFPQPSGDVREGAASARQRAGCR